MGSQHIKLPEIQIGRFTIGPGHRPFLIAEMSGNHNQSLDRALEIVEAAANSGAHAVKLQTYTPETMTLDTDQPEFQIRDATSLWNGKRLFDLYREAATPYEYHAPIFKKCHELGLVIHGDADPVVEYPFGQYIFKTLPEPKTWWSILEGKHTDVFWEHQKKYRKDFLAWLERLP